jgi:hypothetical protein
VINVPVAACVVHSKVVIQRSTESSGDVISESNLIHDRELVTSVRHLGPRHAVGTD